LENNQILPPPTAMAEPSEETVTPPISLPGYEYVQRGSAACAGGMRTRRNTKMKNTVNGEGFPEYMHIASDSWDFF
jgi:hypothetical protein